MRAFPAVLAVILFTVPLSSGSAQSADRRADERAVIAVLEQLFTAMETRDTAALRSTMVPEAALVRALTRDGVTRIERESVDGFVEAVGKATGAPWIEKMYDTEVRIDADLAGVWTMYEFFLGDRFSHCGVDAVHLTRTADGWKIFHLTDTRRREGCRHPAPAPPR